MMWKKYLVDGFKEKNNLNHHTSFSISLYSLTLSTATILVSSSEFILTSQLSVCVTCKPTMTRFLSVTTGAAVPSSCAPCVTHIESVGYRQADQATVQRVLGNNSKQGSKEHHQVSNEFQTDGQPSAEPANM